MLKVLFADDEPLMLEGLRFLVDWEKLDFEVCGEALDGEDALQLILSTRPDLVITDVRMPVIGGLELIRNLAEGDYQPKFIIFSGYADFEYAQEAIRYGVSNYLTKPLDERELTEALQIVAEQIRAERKLASRQALVSAFIQAESVSRLLIREKDFFQQQNREELALLPAGLKKSLLQSVTEGQLDHLSSKLRDVFAIFASDRTSSAWIDAFLSNIKAELLREIDARGGDPALWSDKWFPPRATACCLPLLERQTQEDLREAAEWFASADNGQEDLLVTAAIDYVGAHYQEKLKLQDIAKHLHVNAAYLGQRIKKRYGISFNEFLHEYRIEEAKKLLRRTDMCISDISGRVGYSDADLFAAKFKALNGVSPSVYKKG